MKRAPKYDKVLGPVYASFTTTETNSVGLLRIPQEQEFIYIGRATKEESRGHMGSISFRGRYANLDAFRRAVNNKMCKKMDEMPMTMPKIDEILKDVDEETNEEGTNGGGVLKQTRTKKHVEIKAMKADMKKLERESVLETLKEVPVLISRTIDISKIRDYRELDPERTPDREELEAAGVLEKK